jgi:hypothetical protein
VENLTKLSIQFSLALTLVLYLFAFFQWKKREKMFIELQKNHKKLSRQTFFFIGVTNIAISFYLLKMKNIPLSALCMWFGIMYGLVSLFPNLRHLSKNKKKYFSALRKRLLIFPMIILLSIWVTWFYLSNFKSIYKVLN